MSNASAAGGSSISKNLQFAPLHRTMEMENIHAQVNQSNATANACPTRKSLTKCFTVIGDGSDADASQTSK